MDPQQSIETGNWVALAAYMGFSFFVGFAIGFATRTFMKIFFFIAGTLFIAMFLLQYNGVIHVNWDSFEVVYNSMINWVSPHLGGLKSFITTNLSSATAAAFGLFWGLRSK